MSKLQISPKWGLNPTVRICWWCGEDNGVALLGRMNESDDEAPERSVVDYDACPKCEAHQTSGILIVETSPDPVAGQPEGFFLPGTTDYPTGRWAVVSPRFIEATHARQPEQRDAILQLGRFATGVASYNAMLRLIAVISANPQTGIEVHDMSEDGSASTPSDSN